MARKGHPSSRKGIKLGPNPAHSERMRERTPWNKGKTGLQVAWNKGKPAPWAKNNPQTFKKGEVSIRKGKPSPHSRGERNNFWKGGITPLTKQIRGSFKYRQWRSDVYQRDDYTCVWCGVRGNQLNADHIKAFFLIFEENKITSLQEALDCEEFWNINNGRTLCEPCHKKTPNFGTKAMKKMDGKE